MRCWMEKQVALDCLLLLVKEGPYEKGAFNAFTKIAEKYELDVTYQQLEDRYQSLNDQQFQHYVETLLKKG